MRRYAGFQLLNELIATFTTWQVSLKSSPHGTTGTGTGGGVGTGTGIGLGGTGGGFGGMGGVGTGTGGGVGPTLGTPPARIVARSARSPVTSTPQNATPPLA